MPSTSRWSQGCGRGSGCWRSRCGGYRDEHGPTDSSSSHPPMGVMRTFHLFRQFLDDIRVQKLRTALTVLGITWGTAAVVVLLAFGVGLTEQMKRNARGMGDGIVLVFGGRTTRAYQGFGDGRLIRLQEEDAALIAREVSGIEGISPEYGGYVRPIRRGTVIANPYITGVLPVYGDLRNIVPVPGGRFLNELDVQGRRRVAVLGDELKKLLFGDAEAVGQQVFVGEVPFTVVGVMQHKTQNSSYRSRDQDRLFIPASTYRALFGSGTSRIWCTGRRARRT